MNDPINNKYYTGQREVTLTVTDRFFAGTRDMIRATFTDYNWNPKGDSGYTVKQLWEKTEGTNDYVTIIQFDYEGDYTISVNGKDKSGRDIKHEGQTGYTSEEFTHDWTPPKLYVSWDNMNAVNGKYYTSGRNVNFTIEERNFDNELVTFNGSHPSWGNGGTNIHTLSQSYQSEGDFSIVLSGED